MDIIIIGCLICAAAFSFALNWVFMVRVARLEECHKNFDENLLKFEFKIEDAEERLNRLELAKESIEPTKPIKPNNWDSMRQIFKKPVRVDIDESN